MPYKLKDFTSELDAVVREECGRYRHIVQKSEPLMRRLLSDMRWLTAPYCEPKANGSVQYLLHRSSDFGYVITSAVFSPGYRTKVHDHGTWGLVAVWRGEEREERFRRVDAAVGTGDCKISLQETVLNTEGSISFLIPPEEEIHRIQTISPYPSCSIHIYGSDLDGRDRHEFELETGKVKKFKVNFVVLD